jgi:acyl dehydratase
MFKNLAGIYVRGEGGFGGERGPSGSKNEPPDRSPDRVVSLATRPNQAQIYRLSGDKNPLHVDPEFARLAGLERPILHGLCTYGHVARAVLRAYCDNDPGRLRALEVRFSDVVYPGDTLTTEMWRTGDGRVALRTCVGSDRIVISHAAAEVD